LFQNNRLPSRDASNRGDAQRTAITALIYFSNLESNHYFNKPSNSVSHYPEKLKPLTMWDNLKIPVITKHDTSGLQDDAAEDSRRLACYAVSTGK
jgi:hypothetical protein